MAARELPQVSVQVDASAFGGGLDLTSPPGQAQSGTARFATNYEAEFGGGYRRLGGFERFSGRPSPHAAIYTLLEATAGFTGLVVGDAVNGLTSGTTGVVIYVTATRIGVTKIVGGPFVNEVTKIVGGPFVNEVIREGVTARGTVTETQPVIDGFLDNVISEAAANHYRTDIVAPAGADLIRGVAILNSVVYCWRGSGGNLITYKQGATGWTVVPLFSQVGFTGGSAVYAEGSALVQGANTATVKRVVLESGNFVAGTAAGRLIIDPVAGVFAAGAATGGGACVLAGAAAVISVLDGGRVQTFAFNFTASLNRERLYCCDGVNAEFEFDGTVLVPITTGMGAVRATQVIAHKNHLFYLYRGSLQHSSIGDPYQWSAVTGAAELGTGDVGTGLLVVSGSESSAALMVICRDSVFVLYGTAVGGSQPWDFKKISDQAGGQANAAQEIAGVHMTFDRDGFNRFKPTQSFGNFEYESVSRNIDPLVRNASVKCSVLVRNKSRYRCFFSDGLFISATFTGKRFEWMPCDYGMVIECAVGGEIDGFYRVFYGGFNGMVYEADVGRSFDGLEVEAGLRLSSQNQRSPLTLKQYRHAEVQIEAESAFEIAVAGEFDDSDVYEADVGRSFDGLEVEAGLRLSSQNQRSPLTLKQYRHAEVQIEAESAFEIAVAGEFDDSDPNSAGVSTTNINAFRQVYGAGLFYDFNSWDRAYWDVALVNRLRFPIHGQGRSMSLLLRSLSTNELPHTLKTNQIMFTPRKLAR